MVLVGGRYVYMLHELEKLHLDPAAGKFGAVLGFNFLGDALRDQLDPRTRLEMGL